MINTIEIYIRNEEVLVQHLLIQTVQGHPCTTQQSLKKEKIIPQADKLALEAIKEFAKEKELQIEVYNVSTFKGKSEGCPKRN